MGHRDSNPHRHRAAPSRRPRGVALIVWALALAAAAAPGRAVQAADADAQGDALRRQPHIVLVLADDLGIGDLGAYNAESGIPTPHLDKVAAEGARFTDAHSPSAVCTPTRYGLLSGRYAWRTRLKHGVLWGESACLLEPGRWTIATVLGKAGYESWCVGKWHLGFGKTEPVDYAKPLRPGPVDFGFDHFFGVPAALDMSPYVYLEDDRPVAAASEWMEPGESRRAGGAGFWRPGPAAPGFRHEDVLPRLTDKCEEIIAAHDVQEPLLLYFALPSPHTPWVPLEEYEGKSEAGPYGDFVVQIDVSVGRVVAALEAAGMYEDTIFVFTSDNGAHWMQYDKDMYAHRANMAWRGQKGDIWEGGHRVPFVVRWPGVVDAGTVVDEAICQTDFLATFAELGSVELPEDAGEDSFSFLPLLRPVDGRERAARPAIVHHSFDGVFAVRDAHWKLIFGLGSGGFTNPSYRLPSMGEPPGQLYDLDSDPGETKNLFAEEEERVQSMVELLEKFAADGRSVPRHGE